MEDPDAEWGKQHAESATDGCNQRAHKNTENQYGCVQICWSNIRPSAVVHSDGCFESVQIV
jgi:hypothetical protein